MEDEILLKVTRDELDLIREALGTVKFLKPRQSTATEAQLCKRFSDILKNPAKHHPFAKPRIMGWLEKSFS